MPPVHDENDDVRALWQAQPVLPLGLSAAELAAKATRFRGIIAARNRREWLACVFVGLFFTYAAITAQELLLRVSFVLTVVGTAYVAWYMRKHAVPGALPGAGPCLDFYRGELERQRDLLRGIWRWYLGPLVPGLAVMAIAAPSALLVGLFVVVFGGVGWLNQAAAAALQRDIDALPPSGDVSS
jgi:hypothetical protein